MYANKILSHIGIGIGIGIGIEVKKTDPDSDPDSDSEWSGYSCYLRRRSHHLLPTANCQLPTANCQLPTAHRSLFFRNSIQGIMSPFFPRPGESLKEVWIVTYLILVSIVWGFSFIIIKGTLVSLDSNFVSLIRMLLSFLVFIPFIRVSGIRLSDKFQFMLIGGIQFGLMYVAYVASYQYMPAHMIALLTTTTPLFVSIIGDLYAKEIHKGIFWATLLAVAGGAIIKLPEQSLSASLLGIVLIQISNAAFAFGQIAYGRLMHSRSDLKDRQVFGIMYAGAVVVAGIFSITATNFRQLSVEPQQWMSLAYLGLVASGLGFFLWNLGARRVQQGTLAVMNNLKIPVGVIASLLILKEHTDYVRLFAGCILFAAALWVNQRIHSRSAMQA
jgi:drug/metabolite transporter (DMT)-like permease